MCLRSILRLFFYHTSTEADTYHHPSYYHMFIFILFLSLTPPHPLSISNQKPTMNHQSQVKAMMSRPLTSCTNDKQEPISIDLNLMTQEEINSLRRTDPFLYHSIPAVAKARLSCKDTSDYSQLIVNFPSEPRRRTSSGSAGNSGSFIISSSGASRQSSSSATSIVSRKTKLSVECSVDAAIDDLLNLDDETFMAQCRELGLDASNVDFGRLS